MDNKQEYFNSIKNVTAADGRHCLITAPLREYFSEHALHKYRLLVELKHLMKMSDMGQFGLRKLDDSEKKELMKLFDEFSDTDSQAIAEYDHFGRNGIGATEHDVKSVELYIREKLKGTKFEYLLPMIHFGFTSEDVSHIAYNCMIKGAVDSVWMPELVRLCDRLKQLSIENKDIPMLSRTHGQPASPTTFGKEMAVYLKRFANELKDLKELKLSAKMNGAVGNYNAHYAGYPNVDWIAYSQEFAEGFGFEFEPLTNQRGPKNRVVKLFQNIIRLNTILKDLDIDMWVYVAKDLVLQQKVESHVGSSVMPHKINPWLIECSEGNTEVSNALFEVFCRELEVSRLQRDLSDHDLERNYGAAFAYSLVALKYTNDFLTRISVNSQLMLSELKENSQVLSEAYQTILRAKGKPEAYNMFKDIFRDNVKFDEAKLSEAIQKLDIDENTKKQLAAIKAENYLGETSKLVDIAVKYYDGI